MSRFEILHNPRCTKSRQTLALLNEAGVDLQITEYLETAPSEARIRQLFDLLQFTDVRMMMRTKEKIYAELGLKTASQDELFGAMAEHPRLIERPIVIRDDRAAVIGRPPQNVNGWL